MPEMTILRRQNSRIWPFSMKNLKKSNKNNIFTKVVEIFRKSKKLLLENFYMHNTHYNMGNHGEYIVL